MKLLFLFALIGTFSYGQYSTSDCLSEGEVQRSKLTDVDGFGWFHTEDHSLMYYEGKPFTGAIVRCSGNDVVYRASVVDGKMHGEEIEFYRKNQLHFKRTWVHGVLEGDEVALRRDGDTLHFLSYKNGKINGRIMGYGDWSISGNGILFKLDYTNGYRDGEFIWYFENGLIWRKGHYSRGYKDGEEIDYDFEGNLASKKIYKSGDLISCKGYCPDPGTSIDEIEELLEYNLRHIENYVDGSIQSDDY